MDHPPRANAAADANGTFHPQNPTVPSPVLHYPHRARIVPNYVLDRIFAHQEAQKEAHGSKQAHAPQPHSQQPESSQTDHNPYASFANDPYIQAVKQDWHQFLVSVKEPQQYTLDVVGTTTLVQPPAYFQPWTGEERLRLAIVAAGEPALDAEHLPGFWRRMFHRKLRNLEDSPRHRTKAGYWMLDEKRKDVMPTLHRIFIQNPLVPLLLRILILMFSACALAMAVLIYIYLKRRYEDYKVGQQPSTILAIVVQCFAIVYVVYIAYDEYLGKPMGLRNPLGKMKLVMFDMLFIICLSANMSLAYYLLYDDEWVCKTDRTSDSKAYGIFYPTVGFLCRRQKALSSFLLIVLFLWVLTFTITIIRLIDRVSTRPGHA